MNYSSKNKKILSAMMCIVLCLVMLVPFIGVQATDQGIDVIFVVDDTRSMQETDPDKLSKEAINKFVDIIPTNADVRLGITTYAIDVIEGGLPLGQTPESIKNFANTRIIQDGRGTDAAMGMKWGVEQLVSGSGDGRKKSIILIGDGDNSFVVDGYARRTHDESNAVRDAAIADAQAKGIEVHTIAINPVSDDFRQYFENIAQSTGGVAYTPTTLEEVHKDMDSIYEGIFGVAPNSMEEVDIIDPNVPITQNFEVPSGVFEMNLRCDHKGTLEIEFKSPDGTILNKGSAPKAVYSKEATYTNIKIHEPLEGTWQVTYRSDTAQTIKPQFIMHADLTVELGKNQDTIIQKQDVQYIAKVFSKGTEITEANSISGFNANLVITVIDDQGNYGKSVTKAMSAQNSQFVLDHAIDNPGKYEVYAELVGNKSTIKSNKLTINVERDPNLLPWWVVLLIVLGSVIIVVVIVILIIKSMVSPGTGPVRGKVSLKISARDSMGDSMVFQQDNFDCLQVFGKKNTMSDLVSAYTRRYRINNSSELAENALAQYINTSLSEVTDKISICGNKKKQIIFTVPSGYGMQVDGIEISKPKTYNFTSRERTFELRFSNGGNSYILNVVFSKN